MREVLEDQKVNIRINYLNDKSNTWWGTMEGKLNEPCFNWGSFTTLLREKYYPFSLHCQKEHEFLHLNQDINMVVIYYTAKCKELARFTPEFVAIDKMKENVFEKGLDTKIVNHLAGHHITTYRELYNRASDVKWVNNLTKSSEGPKVNKQKCDSKGYNSRRKNNHDCKFSSQ